MLIKINFFTTITLIQTIIALDYSEVIINGSLNQISYDIVRNNTSSFIYSNCHSFNETITCNVTESLIGSTDKTCSSDFKLRSKVNKYLFKSLTEDRILMSFDIGPVLKSEFHANFVKYREEPLKIRILRISDCSSEDISVPGAVSGLVVINDDGSFDLVYSTEDTVSLGQGTYRIRYDAEGRKIRETKPYVVFSLPAIRVVFTEPLLLGETGSYLHEVSPELQHSLFRVNPNGEAIPIASDKDYLMSTSSAQGILGVCWVNDLNNVTCRQYDVDGQMKMNVDLEILSDSESAFFAWQSPFNLEKGGILLVGGFMGKISPENLNFELTNFTIVEIKPDGRYEKHEEIQGLDFECSNKISPYSSIVLTNVVDRGENNDFCIQFLCARYLSKSKSALRYSTKCRRFSL